jgi:succinate dehydrogenase hydrophobic anchor subunit
MLIGLAMTGSATLARADVKDYEFQLIDKTEQLVSATQRLMIVVPLALFLIFLLLFFSLGSIPDAHVFRQSLHEPFDIVCTFGADIIIMRHGTFGTRQGILPWGNHYPCSFTFLI